MRNLLKIYLYFSTIFKIYDYHIDDVRPIWYNFYTNKVHLEVFTDVRILCE